MIIPIVVLLAPNDSPRKGIITFSIEFALKKEEPIDTNVEKAKTTLLSHFSPFL
jgi:hypothetical protein